jgi:MFS family permease
MGPSNETVRIPFTGYQKFVIAVLAFLQFTIILDFMILSPLGALLMPSLKISPLQFGWLVSVYAFSAGISGFLAAGFADGFDRKTILLFCYAGFILGTFLCGIAPSYHFFLVARVITGLFGGVMGSVVFAITTDLFPYQMRGRVMGFIQTAFAASQVLGIPVGLFLVELPGMECPLFSYRRSKQRRWNRDFHVPQTYQCPSSSPSNSQSGAPPIRNFNHRSLHTSLCSNGASCNRGLYAHAVCQRL